MPCLAAAVLILLARWGMIAGTPAATAQQSGRSWAEAPSEFAPALHGLDRRSQLSSAFAAAFGAGDSTVRRVGAMSEATRFTPGALVQAPFGPVLISEGEVIAPHAESAGKIAIVYMRAGTDRFEPRRQFIPAIESGSMGRIDEFRVRHDLSSYPVVEVHGHASWRGVRCGWITLLELRPEAPYELATIADSYDDSEAALGDAPTRITGEIGNVVPGRSFELIYSGSARFSERYVRNGNGYALASRSRMETC